MDHIYDRIRPEWCETHMRNMIECEKAEHRCPLCAALRAKLDRDKLAKVVLGATHPTDEKPYTSYEEVADAIIAYMEGK